MVNDQIQHESQSTHAATLTEFLCLVRATLLAMPEVRLAYYQPAPAEARLRLMGPDFARVVPVFTRNVSSEHKDKRLARLRRKFARLLPDEVEFPDIEEMNYRDACELAFNAQVLCGAMEVVERDRLYRYNTFLQWNASRKYSGMRQEQPPALAPSMTRSAEVVSTEQFVTPIYRHLKMIDHYLREMKALSDKEPRALAEDETARALAESCILKGVQSAILITMSVMHRKMRLAARDYRDLFLLMPVLGFTHRERASRLAKCADVRDRLIFQTEEVAAMEIYQHLFEVAEGLRDFKAFMLEWLFDHYYGQAGELIQTE